MPGDVLKYGNFVTKTVGDARARRWIAVNVFTEFVLMRMPLDENVCCEVVSNSEHDLRCERRSVVWT
jgi:hypothetical protein